MLQVLTTCFRPAQAFLDSLKENINVNRQLLCYTLAGNRCDLLTITANDEGRPSEVVAFGFGVSHII